MAKSNSKTDKSTKDPIGDLLSGLFGVGRSRSGKNGASDDGSDDNNDEQKAEEEAKQEAEKQVAEQSVKNKADIESSAKAANKFVGSHDAAKATTAASDKVRQAARAQLQAREAAKAEATAQARDENVRREAIEKTLLDPNVTGDVTKEMAELAAPRSSGQMKHGSRPLQTNSDNQPLGPTRSQQAAYLGALNRERAQVGEKQLSKLDIIAGNGAMLTKKATDLSQLPQTRPVPNGFKNEPVLTNPSANIRPLTINDLYKEKKRNVMDSVTDASKRIIDAYQDGAKDARPSGDALGFNQETKDRHRFVNSRPYNPVGLLAQPLNEAITYPAFQAADELLHDTRRGFYGGASAMGQLVEEIGLGDGGRAGRDIRGMLSQIPGPVGRTFGFLNSSLFR